MLLRDMAVIRGKHEPTLSFISDCCMRRDSMYSILHSY